MRTIETWQRVALVDPAMTTRFRFRAERRCRDLNGGIDVPFYRWEVVRRARGGWQVVAMQNVAAQ